MNMNGISELNKTEYLKKLVQITESTLELLKDKRDIIKGQSDGELTASQMVVEREIIEKIDERILNLDSEFLRLYEVLFKGKDSKSFDEAEREVVLTLQQLIPSIQAVRDDLDD